MKFLSIVFLYSLCILGCTNNNPRTHKEGNASPYKKSNEKLIFFPVTSFIKGEIASIKQAGINPWIVTIANGKKDSVWLKVEDFSAAFAPYLTPEIDSSNLIDNYKETSFLDQTICTYTFLYEPSKQLPGTFSLRRWDVYIDQQSNKVQRIYMQKQWGDTIQHLTWLAGKWAKTISMLTKNNEDIQLRETTIHWNFDE
ncbi:MAG: hypothetical protein ABIW38_09575 [Ferruginibacter sp.]